MDRKCQVKGAGHERFRKEWVETEGYTPLGRSQGRGALDEESITHDKKGQGQGDRKVYHKVIKSQAQLKALFCCTGWGTRQRPPPYLTFRICSCQTGRKTSTWWAAEATGRMRRSSGLTAGSPGPGPQPSPLPGRRASPRDWRAARLQSL